MKQSVEGISLYMGPYGTLYANRCSGDAVSTTIMLWVQHLSLNKPYSSIGDYTVCKTVRKLPLSLVLSVKAPLDRFRLPDNLESGKSRSVPAPKPSLLPLSLQDEASELFSVITKFTQKHMTDRMQFAQKHMIHCYILPVLEQQSCRRVWLKEAFMLRRGCSSRSE